MDYNVVSFSGGKDSTAMLLMMLEKGMKIDEIIFCDTGVEFQQIYKHIYKLKDYIQRPITVLNNNSFYYYMFDYVKTKGRNKGKKGYSWPDYHVRWCTYWLKLKPYLDYLKKYQHYNIIEYIGIAFDEKNRVNKSQDRNIKYPLIEWGVEEKQALEYCYESGFDWDGLYKKFDRLSCYCCPLQRLSELRILYVEFPELWEQLKQMDRKSIKQFDRQFKDRYSIVDLEKRFKIQDLQLCLLD